MTSPIDLVLSRLEGHKLRPNGRDRWRACCPAHDGSNPSALSIVVGDDGVVLVRCWQGCSFAQVVAALGLAPRDLFPEKPGLGPRPARRRLLSASQALELLEFEATLVRLCAVDLARGETLDEKTRERLLLGAARVSMMRAEVDA